VQIWSRNLRKCPEGGGGEHPERAGARLRDRATHHQRRHHQQGCRGLPSLTHTLSRSLSLSRTLPFSLELTHTLSHSCSLSNSLFLFPVYQRRHHQQGCRGVSSHSSLSHTLSPTHTRSLSGPVTSPSPTRPSRCVLSLSLTHTNTHTHTLPLTLSHTLSLSLRTSNVAITNQAVEFPLPSPKPYQCQQGLNPNPETRANAD